MTTEMAREEIYRKFDNGEVNEDGSEGKEEMFEVQGFSHFLKPRPRCETWPKVLQCVLLAFSTLFLLVLIMMVSSKFWQVNQDLQEMKKMIMSFNTSVKSAVEAAKATALTQTDACKNGWDLFQSSCYYLSKSDETWYEAKEDCEFQQSHLTVINTKEEQKFLWTYMRLVREHIWIGLHDINKESEWEWVDGTDYATTPKFWDIGQPDNWDRNQNLTEDCSNLHSSGSVYRGWNDDSCSVSYKFICEKEL